MWRIASCLCAICAACIVAGCGTREAIPGMDWPAELKMRPGEEIVLDGSGSFDPEGERLFFRWRQCAGPPVELRDADTPWPRFVPPAPGRYEFELVVVEAAGKLASPPARLAIDVAPPNRPPIVRVDREVAAEPGQWVVLDGGASEDPDGDELEFRWELLAEPRLRELVEMEPFDGRARRLHVRAWKTGEYLFRLVVRDPHGAESSESVRLKVAPRNLNPVAVPRVKAPSESPIRLGYWPHPSGGENLPPCARGSVTMLENGEVLLDGRASYDPNGDALKYTWAQTHGPPVRILRALSPGAAGGETDLSIVAFTPPSAGRYGFRLVVSDGALESPPYELEFDIPGEVFTWEDSRPAPNAISRLSDDSLIARAGPDRIVEIGTEVILDGSKSSSPRRARLLYEWRQVSGPRVLEFRMESLAKASRVRFIPKEPGRYEFALRVSQDGVLWSEEDKTVVTVLTPNRPPELRVREYLRCLPGEHVRLSAIGLDPDGDPVKLSWRVVSGSVRKLRSRGARIELTTSEPGLVTIEVRARDSRGASARKRVILEVVDTSRAPVASARWTVRGRRVVLDGRDSYDPEGRPLRYRWDVVGPALLRLNGQDSPRASFTPPGPGRYEFELKVRTNSRESLPVRTSVEVVRPGGGHARPAIRLSRDRLTAGTPLVLEARTPLIWKQLSGPSLALPTEPRERLVLLPTEPGTYELYAIAPGLNCAGRAHFRVVERNLAPEPRVEVRKLGEGRVVLDGSRSYDPDGDALAFRWLQTAGPSLELRNAPRLFLDGLAPGRYAFQLVVTDGERVARSRELEFEVLAR